MGDEKDVVRCEGQGRLILVSCRGDCKDHRGVTVVVRGHAWQGNLAVGEWPGSWGVCVPGRKHGDGRVDGREDEHDCHNAAHREDARQRQVHRNAGPGVDHDAPRAVACDSSEEGEVRVGTGSRELLEMGSVQTGSRWDRTGYGRRRVNIPMRSGATGPMSCINTRKKKKETK